MALEQRRRRRPCSSPWARPSSDAACAALHRHRQRLRRPLRSPTTSRLCLGLRAGSVVLATDDQDLLNLLRAAQRRMQQLHARNGWGWDGLWRGSACRVGLHASRGAGGCVEHPPADLLTEKARWSAHAVGGSTGKWLQHAVDSVACVSRAL